MSANFRGSRPTCSGVWSPCTYVVTPENSHGIKLDCPTWPALGVILTSSDCGPLQLAQLLQDASLRQSDYFRAGIGYAGACKGLAADRHRNHLRGSNQRHSGERVARQELACDGHSCR